MEADQAPGPGMPSVDDGDLVAGGRMMGLLVRDWTTALGRTRPLAPSRPPRRSCCGRLRFPNQLRRPPRPWRSGLSCSNIQPGPLHGGRPVSPEGSGFCGIALAYNTRSKEEVQEVLEEAKQAGAHILKPAQDTFWGGYSGYFSDPDGHPWEVAWNPGFNIKPDGTVRLPA
jgi:catechol 2,3-dioxygenase-like lactoylglutathione lyase family enzyme